MGGVSPGGLGLDGDYSSYHYPQGSPARIKSATGRLLGRVTRSVPLYAFDKSKLLPGELNPCPGTLITIPSGNAKPGKPFHPKDLGCPRSLEQMHLTAHFRAPSTRFGVPDLTVVNLRATF